jgi:DNA-binding MarR family transcriptional regulator
MNKIQAEAVRACDAYELIQALMRAGKHTEMQLDTALAPTGLSAAKWNALRHLLAAGGQLPLGQLATKLSCVKSNATQLVDRLEAEKLVCRLPDPDDRRSIRAEITAEGRHAYTLGEKVVQRFERQLLEDYSLEEQFLLSRLLARLSGEEGQNLTQRRGDAEEKRK